MGLNANLLIAFLDQLPPFCVWFSVEQHFCDDRGRKVAARNYKTIMFIELNHFDSQMTGLER